MLFSGVCHVVAFTTLVILSWLPFARAFQCFATVATFLYLSYQIGNLLDTLPRFRVSAKKKAVFVTGCDSGFGHLLAHRLDSIGYKVYAGCLQPNGQGADQLRSSSSRRLTILPLDVTSVQSVNESKKYIEDNLDDLQLWAVVNNAGIVVRGELEWTPLDDYQKQFDVNTLGVVRVTQAFLPLLRRHKGRLVTTTSFGGRSTLSALGSYCMSKFATNSFCEGLRMELKKFNIPVITVEPFSYRTTMTVMDNVMDSADKTWSRALSQSPNLVEDYGEDYIEKFKESLRKFNAQSANPNVHQVIDALVEAVTCTNPHYSYVVGDLRSRVVFWFVQRMPSFMAQYIVGKFVTFDVELTSSIPKNKRN